MAAQHKDFGEKIGGAKKDLWGDRGLYASDLDGMNQREADHHVKKDNIWKRPDYQALIASGVEVDAAYYIKKVRDAISPRPLYRISDNNWIDDDEWDDAEDEPSIIDTPICWQLDITYRNGASQQVVSHASLPDRVEELVWELMDYLFPEDDEEE